MNACMPLPCKAQRDGNPADILFMCRCVVFKSLYEHNLPKVTAIYSAFLTLRVYLCFFHFHHKVRQTTSWTCNEMIQIFFLVKNSVASVSALHVNDATNQNSSLLMNKSVHTTKQRFRCNMHLHWEHLEQCIMTNTKYIYIYIYKYILSFFLSFFFK